MVTLTFLAALMIQAGPHLEYYDEAEALGRSGRLSDVCVDFGVLTKDDAGWKAVFDDFQRRAVAAQVYSPLLPAAVRHGAEQEESAIVAMMDFDRGGPSQRAAREEAAGAYIGNGCKNLLEQYPSVFKLARQ